jgi:hypothetical protein
VAARRAVNEAAVRQFFAASDPAWRWVLILGLRDLRANAGRLGELASAESRGNKTWSEDAREHLNELVSDRAILRYKMSGPPVNFDDLVEVSRRVLVLLRIAATNRLAIPGGLNEDSQYCFELPGATGKETLSVSLELANAPTLAEFPK